MKKLLRTKFILINILMLSLVINILIPCSNIAKADTIKLNRTKITLALGNTITLKLSNTKSSIYWCSSKPKVASVTNAGKVTAKRAGNAKIYAIINDKKYSCKITVMKPSGTKNNPYSAFTKHTLTFKDYSFTKSKKISLELKQIFVGDIAYSIIHNENQYNKEPVEKTQWILMQFHLEYLSGSDEPLSASDVFRNYKCFYNAKGSKHLSISEFACFSKYRSGKDIYDVVLDPKNESDVWIGILVDKSAKYPLFSIPTGNGKYTWFTTNPVTK